MFTKFKVYLCIVLCMISLVSVGFSSWTISGLEEEKTDFFVAPASTQFHSNCEGGLSSHSVNVYKRFKNKRSKED